MDWFLDGGEASAVRRLRREILAYLQRHGDEVATDDAELIVQEVLANAVRHASGPIWVSVDWTAPTPELSVNDLGPGFSLREVDPPDDPLSEHGRGLAIVSHLAPKLEVAAKRGGGSRVTVELPASRPAEASFGEEEGEVDPLDPLPAPEEADASGAFDRESFLRALVVQLARVVEREEGPAAAEKMVALVGRDVGGRMEDAYREAERISETLSVEQMGDLYVRLKHAIDGEFSVVEATEERIVLANRRCPFGDAVKRAPALCRMTSSVFGGIAARNRGRAAVQLEERIAVGDPGCRVVVWLRDADARATHFAHRYAAG